MRRYLVTLLASAVLVSCSTTVPPEPDEQSVAQHQPDAIDSADWQLVWQDEFDSNSIDQSKWSFEQHCWGGGNDEQQCYTNRPENAYVDNGVLYIVARKETFTGPALHEDAPDFSPHQRKTLPRQGGLHGTPGARKHHALAAVALRVPRNLRGRHVAAAGGWHWRRTRPGLRPGASRQGGGGPGGRRCSTDSGRHHSVRLQTP